MLPGIDLLKTMLTKAMDEKGVSIKDRTKINKVFKVIEEYDDMDDYSEEHQREMIDEMMNKIVKIKKEE